MAVVPGWSQIDDSLEFQESEAFAKVDDALAQRALRVLCDLDPLGALLASEHVVARHVDYSCNALHADEALGGACAAICLELLRLSLSIQDLLLASPVCANHPV